MALSIVSARLIIMKKLSNWRCFVKSWRICFLFLAVILLLYFPFESSNVENSRPYNIAILTHAYTEEILWQRELERRISITTTIFPNIVEQTLWNYPISLTSVQCYAKMNNYSHYVFIDKEAVYHKSCYISENDRPDVKPLSKFYFKRHCATVAFLENHPEHEWILILDGDIGVINPYHRIEEYIDQKVDLIFYERIFNWEIMTGAILIRNTEYSREFFANLAKYFYKIPISTLTDNHALHFLFMDYFASEKSKKYCNNIYRKSNYSNTPDYELCARHKLGKNKKIFGNKIKVLPKGEGWVRDSGITETKFGPSDFMFHGWKHSTMNQLSDDPWLSPFEKENFNLSTCKPIKNGYSTGYNNWAYEKDFIETDKNIKDIVQRRIWATEKRYARRIKFLNIDNDTS